MKDSISTSSDIRQSAEWGRYLENIGWTVERIGKTQIAINRIPLFHHSLIKIQHPIGKLPLKEIDSIAKKYKALFVLIEPHSSGYNEATLLREGYRTSRQQFAPTATIKIDLNRSEKELYKSFSENAQRNIRKSQASNLKLQFHWLKNEKDDKVFEMFYDLHANLGKMKQFYVPSREHMRKKAEAMKDVTLLLFAYEKEHGVPIATVWLSVKDGVMTYLHTGITEKGYELLANYLLVWEAMKIGQTKGFTVFDFEIIYDMRYPKEHRKWIGYTEFKKRFHGTIQEYPPRWIKYYNPFYKLLDLCISRFQ